MLQAAAGVQGDVQVELGGEVGALRAKVITLEGYSAHADQVALVDYVLAGKAQIRNIVLVHGERTAKQRLAQAIIWQANKMGLQVEISIP